jgi:hypothetical protein
MLVACVANATLFGVGGVVASLQAIKATPAATAASLLGTTRIRQVYSDGAANVYTIRDFPQVDWCGREDLPGIREQRICIGGAVNVQLGANEGKSQRQSGCK